GIDIVMKTEADNSVIAGVERPFRTFAENRAKGVDERFPDVGPVPAGSCRDADGQADRSRSRHCGGEAPISTACAHRSRRSGLRTAEVPRQGRAQPGRWPERT